ncbi:MAG TPA: hypothetical protein VGG27_07020 [Magnetospirillaceae bacterium]
MNSLISTLISFGDSTQAVAALLAGTAFLAFSRNLKAAAILLLAVVIAGGVIGTLKTLFIGCDLYLADFDIRFPSGHAALSSAGLGTVCVLIAAPLTGWKRKSVYASFAIIEAAICTILVAMNFHTFYEVILGLIIGGGAVYGAYLATRITMPAPIKLKGFVLSMAAVVVAIHVAEVPSRDMATILAGVMREKTEVCRPADNLASRFHGQWTAQAQAQARAQIEVDAEIDDLTSFGNGGAPSPMLDGNSD